MHIELTWHNGGKLLARLADIKRCKQTKQGLVFIEFDDGQHMTAIAEDSSNNTHGVKHGNDYYCN